MAQTSEKPVTIIADSNEPPALLSRLRLIPGVHVELRELFAGDFIVGDGVAVERKSAQDFVNSIMDRRLFAQVAKMKGEFETVVLLVEGDISKSASDIAPVALTGALSWLAVIEKVSLISAGGGLGETAGALHRMAIHCQHGLGYEVPLRAGKPKELHTARQFFLEGLPGVGPGLARRLLAHFGTPSAVFSASEKELREVDGVGPGTAKKILEVLG